MGSPHYGHGGAAAEADASEILAELSAFVRASGVALVGHEPSIGVIAGAVLGVRRPFPFKKGGVCRIDVNASRRVRPGEVIWFLAPRVLRAPRRRSPLKLTSSPQLDDRPVPDHAILRHHDDPVADDVVLAVSVVDAFSLTSFTPQPIRAFLSTITRSSTESRPMPSGTDRSPTSSS